MQKHNPGHTPEAKEKYLQGLEEVLQRQREAGETSPEQIASSVIDYRRIFLGDASKILDL